ncbi:MAG: DUF4347 domain-containing protein, partial [Rhodothermales bacterium]|nr:DUF4347 domain-containing protein [Rhodothermales bacterium]
MPKKPSPKALMEELEPRLLFSADLPGVLAEAGLIDIGSPGAAITAQVDAPAARIASAAERPHDVTGSQTLAHSRAAIQGRAELVFVDSRAPNYQQLVQDLMRASAEGRAIEVVVLDAGRDGVEQISEALSARRGIGAVHLVSHGAEGELRLGSSELNARTLSGYREAIAGWQASLGDEADLLIYGCDFAGNADGLAMVDALAKLTGADVAASADRTGAASQGGDWELEINEGSIETEIAFSAEIQNEWQGTLATYEVNTTADSGAGSLRQAIIDANANAGLDTIEFNIALTDPNHLYYQEDGIGGNLSPPVATSLDDASISDFDPDFGATPNSWYRIQLGSALPAITDSVVIDGTTQSGYTDSPVIELDGSSVGGDGLSLDSDGSTIRGLIINGFGGRGVDVTGSSNVIAGNYIGVDASGTLAVANGSNGIRLTAGASDNIIGGITAADRNVISGNAGEGIMIRESSTSGNVVIGNYIGVDASGTTAVGNVDDGVQIAAGAFGNRIGGTTAAERNIISGNEDGVVINGAGARDNLVQGNYIGTDVSGTVAIGNNFRGVQIYDLASDNIIGGTEAGAGNLIAFNLDDGVELAGTAGSNNAILGNSIHSNADLGINIIGGSQNGFGVTANDAGDADTGPNLLQNYPVLTGAVTTGSQVTVNGTINSTANSRFRIELFSSSAPDPSGSGEGETYLGYVDVVTDNNGDGHFSKTFTASVAIGEVITATATDSSNNTSEFSVALATVAANAALVVDTNTDILDGDTSSIDNLIASKGADGFISLREAITAANNTANAGGIGDLITFDIGVGGVQTIIVTAELPRIDDAVIIDGTTQGGWTNDPLIELDGSAVLVDGLYLDSGSDWSTIRGLSIFGFGDDGIQLRTSNNTVSGNFVGLRADGITAAGVGDDGIDFNSSASNNLIGGLTAADRNVVSGTASVGINLGTSGASDNIVVGNYVGTDKSGMLDRGNAAEGILIQGTGNIIGGTSAAERNVISANVDTGIRVELGATNTVIQGNYIGVAADGTTSLGNGLDGILISDSQNTTVGGASTGAGNVIASNSGNGVAITGALATGNVVLGNRIGTDATGTLDRGNTGAGVFIESSAANNTIGGRGYGEGNLIAYNDTGVSVDSTAGTGNTIVGNSIYSNANLGIDLVGGTEDGFGVTANDAGDADLGANELMNVPVLSTATSDGVTTTVNGTFDGAADATITLDFYASAAADPSGSGEGTVYIGSYTIVTDGTGTASFSAPLPFAGLTGDVISATATDASGNTSEFSATVSVGAGGTNTNPVALDDAYTMGSDSTLTVGWWDTAWTKRQQLTFNNLAQAEDLVDFPVLVKLTDGVNIDYTQTQNNGEDLRFVDANGTA